MTGRLPFDPDKMAQSKAPPPADPRAGQPLTVSALAARISGALSSGLPDKLRVIGEVSGFRERTHWYFDLKDADAVVNCAMFAAAARRARFTPGNGQQVVVTGRIDFYDKQGRVTLLVEKIEPVGAGAQELALKALVEEIRKLGWLDESRKRPIPAFANKVAIVTSRSGAALQDVLTTMRKRCPAVDVAIVDARVQGDGAAAEVASALRWLGRHRERLRIDAILVTRGGGSKEDLWAFNERIVAEAIVNSPVPVVAAIGHETDTTVAELVADLRCSTPTQAAMRLTPDRDALAEQVAAMASRLRTVLSRELREAANRLRSAARRPCMTNPGSIVESERRHLEALSRSLRQSGTSRVRAAAGRLERLAGRLEAHRPASLHAKRAATLDIFAARLNAAVRSRLAQVDLDATGDRLIRSWSTANERAAVKLESLQRHLTSVGPVSILNRGFSYTLKQDGTLVRSVSDVADGDVLKTTVTDGAVRSVVQSTEARPPEPPPYKPRPVTPLKRRKPADPRDQMDLFGGSR